MSIRIKENYDPDGFRREKIYELNELEILSQKYPDITEYIDEKIDEGEDLEVILADVKIELIKRGLIDPED